MHEKIIGIVIKRDFGKLYNIILNRIIKVYKKMILQLIQGQDHLYHTPCKPPYTHSWQRFPHVSYMLLLKLYKKCVI